MSPVRCGAVTVRDGRAKRDGDGGGGWRRRRPCVYSVVSFPSSHGLAPLRVRTKHFFSFQRACGANCDIPCWLGRTTTRAKAAAAHCKRLDETENDNVLLT
jgi:hypothetical protein